VYVCTVMGWMAGAQYDGTGVSVQDGMVGEPHGHVGVHGAYDAWVHGAWCMVQGAWCRVQGTRGAWAQGCKGSGGAHKRWWQRGRGKRGKEKRRRFCQLGEFCTGEPEYSFRVPGVPQISPDGFDASVIDVTDIKHGIVTGAPEGLMPFTANLHLVVEQDCVTIGLQPHGVAFEIEVELSKGDDVILRPAGLRHVV